MVPQEHTIPNPWWQCWTSQKIRFW